MTTVSSNPRWRAALVAAVLFGAGVIVGVTVERTRAGRVPTPALAEPLTVEALSRSLDLDTLAEMRVRVLLDSLEPDIAQAAMQGPDSLQAAARRARQRLEAALPGDRREPFRSWMEGHKSRMMQMMHRGMSGRMMERRMERPQSGDSRPMGRGMMEGMMRGMMGGMMGRMMGDSFPPGVQRADLPEPESRGADLLGRYCTACHGLPSPGLHTADEWPGVVERMQQNMRSLGVPIPPGEEIASVLQYLKAHAAR